MKITVWLLIYGLAAFVVAGILGDCGFINTGQGMVWSGIVALAASFITGFIKL